MSNSTIPVKNNSNRPGLFYGCLFFVIFFSLLFRYFSSATVENGGDSIYKWSLIKQYVLFGDIPARWSHHACRWAVNLPVYFIQKYFGTDPGGYYLWPALTATLSAVFSFLLLEKIRGWKTGLAGAILIVLSAPMLQLGTQFLPMGTAVAFLLGSLYFLACWQDNRQRRNVAVSAFLLFFAYGAKVTIVYFFPACLVLIWLLADKRDRVLNVSLFLGIFIALFALETVLFNALTGASFGRWGLIQHSHHPIRTLWYKASWISASRTLPSYLANFFVYFKYPGGANSVLYYAAFSIAVLALVKRWRNTYLVAVPFLFGFLGLAYAITSVFPFIRPERLLFRYQTSIFELALIMIMLFLSAPSFEKFIERYKLPFNLGGRAIRTLLFLALAAPIAVNASKHVHADTGFAKTIRTMALVREARQAHLPVFVPTGPTDRNTFKRIIKYWTFFSDKRWTVPYYETGKLSRAVDFHIEKYPAINRDGKTYILLEDNDFSENMPSRAVFLTDF